MSRVKNSKQLVISLLSDLDSKTPRESFEKAVSSIYTSLIELKISIVDTITETSMEDLEGKNFGLEPVTEMVDQWSIISSMVSDQSISFEQAGIIAEDFHSRILDI